MEQKSAVKKAEWIENGIEYRFKSRVFLGSLRDPSGCLLLHLWPTASIVPLLGSGTTGAAIHSSRNARGSRHFRFVLVQRPLVLSHSKLSSPFLFFSLPSTFVSFPSLFPLPHTLYCCFPNCLVFAQTILSLQTHRDAAGIASPPLVFSPQAPTSAPSPPRTMRHRSAPSRLPLPALSSIGSENVLLSDQDPDHHD